MRDRKLGSLAWARLEGLRQHVPASINEDTVNQYHDILNDLEAALGESFEKSRITSERMKPRITSISPGGWDGSPGHITYGKQSYCPSDYFKSQIDGLWRYLKLAFEDEGPPQEKNRPHSRSHIHVEHMYGSSIQQGTHGSTAHVHFEARDSHLLDLIRRIKSSVDGIPLERPSRDELIADMNTVESQLASPHPKTSVITECLQSARTVLEGIAGNVIASGIAVELGKILR